MLCSRRVVFPLFFREMRVAVNFNTQFYFGAIKINDENLNLVLTPEFEAEISVSQQPP